MMQGVGRLVIATCALLFLAVPRISGAQEDLVVVTGEQEEDGSVVVRASSSHIIPVYLSVDLARLINMEADAPTPFGVELAPGTRGMELFRLRPTSTSGRIGYTLSYRYARGNPLTVDHDDDHLYLVPYAHGDKRRVSQGFRGAFSHYGENEYAIDFEMPEGTEVFAARDGIVAEVKQDSRVGGPARSYSGDANYVLIMHGDGSFANYAHLRYGGAVVAPGDRVNAGDLIGYSGNTGRSSGPHLHFDVRIPLLDGTMQSIPFAFLGTDGEPVEPRENRFYYAYHPGGPPFEEVYGESLTMADFADYAERFTDGSAIDVRVEQIDLTFLVFVQNGLDREADVEVSFQLRGLQSDAGRVVQLMVPAGTEVLASILRPVSGARTIQYGFTVRYR